MKDWHWITIFCVVIITMTVGVFFWVLNGRSARHAAACHHFGVITNRVVKYDADGDYCLTPDTNGHWIPIELLRDK